MMNNLPNWTNSRYYSTGKGCGKCASTIYKFTVRNSTEIFIYSSLYMIFPIFLSYIFNRHLKWKLLQARLTDHTLHGNKCRNSPQHLSATLFIANFSPFLRNYIKYNLLLIVSFSCESWNQNCELTLCI